MPADWTVLLQTFAAVASAIAACAAAWTALEGPKRAAKLAEVMRQENEAAHEEKRLRKEVFSTLMQCRSAPGSPDSLRALNLAEVAFLSSASVRAAVSTFYRAASNRGTGAEHAQNEAYIAMLNAMADDLGIASEITPEVINRVFGGGGTA